MGRTLPAWALALATSTELSLLTKVTALLAISWTVMRLAGDARASVRHLWLASVFGILLLLPAASIVMPPIEVEGEPTSTDTQASAFSRDVPRASGASSIEPFRATAPQRPRVGRISVGMLLGIGWALGALACLAPLIAALTQTRRLRREALPWLIGQPQVCAVAREAGVARGIMALLSEQAVVPVTCGWIHPAILLPATAEHWNDQGLHQALVHEIEHVRRCDWPVHVMARVACALYWFHPLAWVAWRQLCLDAERACDDAVLCTAERTAYAEQLVRLAQQVLANRVPVGLSMASRSDLAARVTAVLDANRSRGPIRRSAVAVAVLAMISCLFTIAPRAEVRSAPTPLPLPSAVQSQAESRPSTDVQTRPSLEVTSRRNVDPDGRQLQALRNDPKSVNDTVRPPDGSQPTLSTAPAFQASAAQLPPQGPMLTNGVNTIWVESPYFCCAEYLITVIERIRANWNERQDIGGQVVIRFTVQRDGQLSDVAIDQSSNVEVLDLAAQEAVLSTKQLPQPPNAFTDPLRRVYLSFRTRTTTSSNPSDGSSSVNRPSADTDVSRLRPDPDTISLDVDGASFSEVLTTLSKASGIQIAVAPDVVPSKDLIRLHVPNVKFVDILTFLLHAHNLNYTIVNEKTVIITKKA